MITIHKTNHEDGLEICRNGQRTGHRLELQANECWALRDDQNSCPTAFLPQFAKPEQVMQRTELLEGPVKGWQLLSKPHEGELNLTLFRAAPEADAAAELKALKEAVWQLAGRYQLITERERNKNEDAYRYRELGSVSRQTAFDGELDGFAEADLPAEEQDREAFIDAQLESYCATFRSDGARLDQ